MVRRYQECRQFDAAVRFCCPPSGVQRDSLLLPSDGTREDPRRPVVPNDLDRVR